MATLRELKKRIKSVGSTEKVTKAMQTVSVSKYNRALSKKTAFGSYLDACRRITGTLGGYAGALCPRAEEAKRVCYVLMTSNRGLCGAYNTELMKYFESVLSGDGRERSVVVCGKWGLNNLRLKQIEVKRFFDIPDVPDFDLACPLADYLTELYTNGGADEIFLVYQSFTNMLNQQPVCERLLPITPTEGEASSEYVFLPERGELLETIMTLALRSTVYGAMLSCASGAQAATLMAMRTAADNSQEMLTALTLSLNRLRQSRVTSEILEISSNSTGGDPHAG